MSEKDIKDNKKLNKKKNLLSGSFNKLRSNLTNVTFGIDISEFQNGLELSLAKKAGVEFVFLRTNDGSHVDLVFPSHLADAEKNGLLIAVYFYMRSPSGGFSIKDQVTIVKKQLKGKDYPVFIDVEDVDYNTLTWSDVNNAKNEIINQGLNYAGVYTGGWYWGSNFNGLGHMGNPNWNNLGLCWVSLYGANLIGNIKALYGGNNDSRWNYLIGGKNVDILQYGSKGRIPGWGGNLDINAFRGTREELKKLLYKNRKPTINKDEEMIEKIYKKMTTKYASLVDKSKKYTFINFIIIIDAAVNNIKNIVTKNSKELENMKKTLDEINKKIK